MISRPSFFWIISLVYLAFEGERVNAQAPSSDRKGQFFLTWGYNRAYYNESDIHFKGDGYDFTLFNAKAEDIPEEFDPLVYFSPTKLTIPQFNFRLGYYFNKNTALSLGWDHMKYHLIATQFVEIDGYIDPNKYKNAEFARDFDHQFILYKPAFMNYHHSDGFNFVRLALEQRIPFLQSKNMKHVLAMNAVVSAGLMLPWTDFTYFGVNYKNRLHLAGYGFSAHAGVRYEFRNHFFIQAHAQFGWTNLVDIMLEDDLPSRAEQKIVFMERSWALGTYFGFKKRNQSKMLE